MARSMIGGGARFSKRPGQQALQVPKASVGSRPARAGSKSTAYSGPGKTNPKPTGNVVVGKSLGRFAKKPPQAAAINPGFAAKDAASSYKQGKH